MDNTTKKDLIFAINNGKTTIITVMHGTGKKIKIEYAPLLLGMDAMQYHIIWGVMLADDTAYKFRFSDIFSVEVQSTDYQISKTLKYYDPREEERYHFNDELMGRFSENY